MAVTAAVQGRCESGVCVGGVCGAVEGLGRSGVQGPQPHVAARGSSQGVAMLNRIASGVKWNGAARRRGCHALNEAGGAGISPRWRAAWWRGRRKLAGTEAAGMAGPRCRALCSPSKG